MINRSLGPLYEKLDIAQEQMYCAKTCEEKLALANYIVNLYCALICMGDTDTEFDKYKCFGGKKNYENFIRKLDVYSDQLNHNIIFYKDFHQDFLRDILLFVEEHIFDLCSLSYPNEEVFCKKDFFEIFYMFLESLGLSDRFDALYKNCHIHSSIVGRDTQNLGFTLHNPLSRETDLFVRNLQFDFPSMNTLAHEFGHGIDYQEFRGDVQKYNRYFYLSFYQEVIARLMERLLHRFLLKNGIATNTVKNHFIDFELLNRDFLLQSYIFSLLDRDFLLNEKYIECDSDVIVRKIKDYFLDEDSIKDFIERAQDIDLSDTFNYAYGDILSLFLCEEVEKNGFFNEVMDSFMKNRGPFKEIFMRESGFDAKKYQKLYKKEVELIKFMK